MQGILQRALEQCRELAPVGGPSGLARKVLEQLASVVGLAKKRAVDSLGRPAHGVPGSERHEDAKRRASQPAQWACRHDRGRFDPEDPGERPRKDKRERHADDAADDHYRVADHDVSSAPPEEDRELHHAISDNRICKGQRQEIEREDGTDPYPERQGQDLTAAEAAGLDVGHQDQYRQHTDSRPPEHHARAPPDLRPGDERVQEQRHQAEAVPSGAIDREREADRRLCARCEGGLREIQRSRAHEYRTGEECTGDKRGSKQEALQPWQPAIEPRGLREARKETVERSRRYQSEQPPHGEERPPQRRVDDRR